MLRLLCVNRAAFLFYSILISFFCQFPFCVKRFSRFGGQVNCSENIFAPYTETIALKPLRFNSAKNIFK